MTRAEFLERNRIEDVLASRGIKVVGKMAKCPLHEDGTASLSVDLQQQVWNCHAGCGGGSSIDLLAKLANQDPITFIKEQGINGESKPPKAEAPVVVKTYTYRDALGRDVFRVLRYMPKTFRQQQPDGKGGWAWGMDGVERVLYRLPEVIAADQVAICEGERDAETLTKLGYCGTCNVGGSGKWLDGYTESVRGKDVLIFGDNDDPGKAHVELVYNSITGAARSIRIIEIPKPFKDVSDYCNSLGSLEKAQSEVKRIVDSTAATTGGINVPVYSMAEMEVGYAEHVKNLESSSLMLGGWIPSLRFLRPLAPGALVMIVGDTGIGKTALLSSIAMSCRPLPTVMFQIELPAEDVFERFLAAATKSSCEAIEKSYRDGFPAGEKVLKHHFPAISMCCESRLSVDRIEEIIIKSELKTGQKPRLVLIDYVQLVSAAGKTSYEKASSVAEDLKRMAKATKTIVVIASQIARPEGDTPEIGLHDAKNSGSLENSAGLVIGAWRDPEDTTALHIKVLKSTKGGAGQHIVCNFDGASMTINERHKGSNPNHNDP